MKIAVISLALAVAAAGAITAVSIAQPGAAPAWVFGDHPVLGKSAHVRIGSDAVGFACGYSGSDLARDDVVSLRVTRGLAPANAQSLTGKVDDLYDIISWRTTDKGTLVEISGNPCEFAIPEVQAAKSLTITIDGRTTVVPTKGSSAAIGKLIASCPRIKQELAWNCGI